MKDEILILGGGVAGISTAIQALEFGFKPTILEKNKYLGGRVRSFYAKDIQQELDNGQHLLSAAYQETIHLLKKINSIDKVSFQQKFKTIFLNSNQERFKFHTISLPPPFQFFIPLIRSNKIGMKEILKYIWKNLWISENSLKKMTISEWLENSGLHSKIQDLLWKPMSLSILNTKMEEGSAYLLKHAISQSFFHSSERAALGFPKDWLSNIFGKPAESFIRNAGGKIEFLHIIKKIEAKGKKIDSVLTQKKEYHPQWVISTVPPSNLLEILSQSTLPLLYDIKEKISHFKYNPIITINIYLEQPIQDEFPISFTSSPLQWIFAHPAPQKTPDNYGYALVISAATEWIEKSREEIIHTAISELNRHFGIKLMKNKKLVKFKIIKEKRATILQTPESLNFRLYPRTPLENFFLAGDWTNTGLPATIESAILSGKRAIENILQDR
jgi:squalene-associated FAD-dependent desaturase